MIECPSCHNTKSLYKLRNDDGTYIIICQYCNYEVPQPISYDTNLDHIPTLGELRQQWGEI